MADPSFDELLESLDAIQAERSAAQRRDSSSSSSSSSDDEDHRKSKRDSLPAVHLEISRGHDSDDEHRKSQYSSHLEPARAVHAPEQHEHHHAPPPPPPALPSRSGDVKQYQRQSIIQPSRAKVQESGDTHCAKCGNSLYGTEYVTAGGKSYHQEHFSCVRCHSKIVGAYYDHHNQTYCPACAGELMPCTKCHRGITGQYMILEGKPYHNECIDRKHCNKCNRPIEDTVLTALGKVWHTRCFTCIQCGRELGNQFVNKDGQGQCEDCAKRARPNCDKCHSALSGEFINFSGKSYHQDCFVCYQCRSRLGTSGFFNVGGNLKCARCAAK